MWALYEFAVEVVVGFSPCFFVGVAWLVCNWFTIWNFVWPVVCWATSFFGVFEDDFVFDVHEMYFSLDCFRLF